MIQKHAFSVNLHSYQTVFAPLPVGAEEAVYFDETAVVLRYAEDFPFLHYHDRYEIGICESGEGLVVSEGQFFSVSAGDLMFVAPGTCHYSRSLHEEALCRCRFVYLRADAVRALLPDE